MAYLEIGAHSLSESQVRDLLVTDHPMVEEFRFDKQREVKGDSVDFALVIVPKRGVRYQQQRDGRGAKTERVWRTLGGDERIGQGNRGMWVQGGQIEAANHSFFPNQEFNDLGIGSALYVAMERLYRRLGIRRVTLLAVDVGVYVWARQAFAFLQPSLTAELVPTLERFLFSQELAPGVDDGTVQESWDLANFDVSGVEIDGCRVGKAFMLDCAPAWHGLRMIDDPRHDRIAEGSRRETFARLPAKIDGARADLAVR